MGDRNPKKRPKQAKVSLKPPLATAHTVVEIKALKDGQRKPGHK